MKICHFTCAHQANDVRIFEKECISLVNAGYEVYLVAPNAVEEIKEGVHIINVPIKKVTPLHRLFYSSALVYRKALELNADIYHFHDIELFLYGVRLKKKGKKVIFDSHEDWVGYAQHISWLPGCLKKYISYCIRKMYKRYLHLFDAVITVTPHIVDMLRKYSDKVHMITNYPVISSEEVFPLDKKEYLSRRNKICYAGTIYRESNQRTVIKAIADIADIKYILVGTLEEMCKNELETIKGWEKVEHINRVPRKELQKIYKSALGGLAIFDYAPNTGGKIGTLGSNKIFEYMLIGIPVICSDQELWRVNIVEQYKCGICVEPGNVEQIKRALLTLLSDKDAAFEMGKNGRNAVLAEFNWAKQEAVLKQIYIDIVGND